MDDVIEMEMAGRQAVARVMLEWAARLPTKSPWGEWFADRADDMLDVEEDGDIRWARRRSASCGARTKTGGECRNWVHRDGYRCRLHWDQEEATG